MMAVVWLFLLFSVATSTYSMPCDPGSGACKTCPPGTDLVSPNGDRCDPCRPGYAAFLGGKSPARFCTLCPPGTFSSKEGSLSCTPCPPGTKSLDGFRKCVKCGPGFQLNELGGCMRCPINTFSDGESNVKCEECPKGSVIDGPGASKCKKCPKGTIASGGSLFNKAITCMPCLAGTFGSEDGAIACRICPPGTFSKPGAKSCTPCPAGQFAPLFASTKCDPCPNGTDSKPGSAACKDPVRGCTFTTFEDKEGKCMACLPGQRLDVARKECVPCKENEVSDGGVSTSCRGCPRGKSPVRNIGFHDGFSCMCPVGSTLKGDGLNCVPCPLGMIGTLSADTDEGYTGAPRSRSRFVAEENDCKFCGRPGTTTSAPGSNECKECPKGSYYDRSTRPFQCKKCPKGFAPALEPLFRYTCRSIKTGCGINATLVRGECRILKCPRNTFLTTTCVSCRKGWFYNKAKTKCSRCPRNQTSAGGATTKCKNCPRNAKTLFGKCVCKDDFELKGKKCVPCKPGTFKLYPGDSHCVPCGRGMARSKKSRVCEDCPEGTIPNKNRDQCVECPKGMQPGVNVRGDLIDRCVPIDPYEKFDLS